MDFFNPRSIALIGASAHPEKVGYAILKNLIDSGFAGGIFPINLSEKNILGINVYPNILAVSEKIDLAIICIPANLVSSVLEECGKKGVKNIVIISAGFKETGAAGLTLENQLLAAAKKYDLKILGPNSLGFMNNKLKLNASFSDIIPPLGPIAFISQSGALCSAVLDLAKQKNIGFSHFVSLGNEVNFKEIEVLTELAKDPETKVLACYLEGISDGQKFLETISAIVKSKPVVILKGGATAKGAKAISSHTGSLVGSYAAALALIKKSGAIAVETFEELLDLSAVLAYQPELKNQKVAIITNAGGPGVLTADACLKNNIELADLSVETIKNLKSVLPASASLHNPIDLIGDADARRYQVALEKIALDKNVGALLVILTPQAMTQIKETALAIIEAKKFQKPIFACFMGGEKIKEAVEILGNEQIINFDFPEKAVLTLKDFFEAKHKPLKARPYVFKLSLPQIKKIEKILAGASGFLPLAKIYEIFKIYKMPLAKSVIIKDEKQALIAAKKIGYPVALKIVSATLIHKIDVAGVILNILSPAELKSALRKMKKNLGGKNLKKVSGFEITEMVDGGAEILLGVKKDQLGHLLVCGWGGTYAELINDVAYGLAPLNLFEAQNIVNQTKISKILQGYRGAKKSDLPLVIETLLKLSDLVSRFGCISELDINPLKIFAKGGKIIDIKLSISK